MNWITMHQLSQLDHAERLANAEHARRLERDGFSESLLERIEAVLAELIHRDSSAAHNEARFEERPVVYTDIRKTDTLTVHTV